MATLKELMGDKTRGDGRKFAKINWDTDRWFEPIFYYEKENIWVGLNSDGWMNEISDSFDEWQEWTPPKKTKKIRKAMYQPVFKNKNRDAYRLGLWDSEKAITPTQLYLIGASRGTAWEHVGWNETEFEVEVEE